MGILRLARGREGSSGQEELHRLAEEAALQWLWIPARKNRVPIKSIIVVPFDFTLTK